MKQIDFVVHKSPPPILILSQANPSHALPHWLCKMPAVCPQTKFISRKSERLWVAMACSDAKIEEQKLRNSHWAVFIKLLVLRTSLSCPNIVLNILFWITLNLRIICFRELHLSLLEYEVRDKVQHPISQKCTCTFGSALQKLSSFCERPNFRPRKELVSQ